MKNIIRVVVRAMMITVLFVSIVKSETEDKMAIYENIVSGYKCNIASETIGKSYFSIGENVGVRQARKEMNRAFIIFSKRYAMLVKSAKDKKIKNLLSFMKMNYDELKYIIKKPYTMDNAQIVLDLVGSVSEAARYVATKYKKQIGYNDPVNRVGLSPKIESIAKYYIAYQSGIKDENTVAMMKNSVDFCEKNINIRMNYPANTPEMNKTIGEVNELWQVVKQFYLDIEEGGLPFIVFRTTTDLKNGNKKYAKMYKELVVKNRLKDKAKP
ncbi:MAG: hypothetical protein U9R27_06105 [Campylobacterota bacterium]|nr:hypothetical protein [Campylobacterota bacterium]